MAPKVAKPSADLHKRRRERMDVRTCRVADSVDAHKALTATAKTGEVSQAMFVHRLIWGPAERLPQY